MNRFYSELGELVHQWQAHHKRGYQVADEPRRQDPPPLRPQGEVLARVTPPAKTSAPPRSPAPVREAVLAPRAFDNLESLDQAVRSCTRCSLCDHRKHAIPGSGSRNPLVMVIGAAPGAEDDLTGMAMGGGIGQFLDKWLEAIGLSRYTNVYVTHRVKCRPQGNDPRGLEAVDPCGLYLDAQVRLLAPRAFLVLGLDLARDLGLGAGLGMQVLWDKPALVTPHPSEVVMNPDLKRPVWEALKAFRQHMGPDLSA